jgi:hypothetical protein
MNEIRAPLSRQERARVRFDRLVGLHAQQTRIELQIRQETAALVEQDTPFALRGFVADELAMTLAESPGTCRRRVEEAQRTVAHPRLMALVAASVQDALDPAQPVVTGWFGMRHADAVLDELAGAPDAVQAQVLDLVLADASARTPHQLRKATRAARLLHDLDGARDKQDRIHDNRGVSLVDELDGSATLLVGGTKTGGAAMLAAIDAHVAVPAAGDPRSLSQRRYDFVMDLLCGRTAVTAPWQALIVVSLQTLEGGDAPAEIPGLGLVSAQETREVLAQADLRRAVVDSQGALVALDDIVLTGDQTPLGPAPVDLVSHETEPAEIDVEQIATAAEQEWLASQQTSCPAEDAFLSARAAVREAQLLTLCRGGIARLEHLLHEHACAHAPSSPSHPPSGGDGGTPPDDPGPPPPTGGGGSGPPPGGPTRPGPVRPGGDGRGNPPDGPPTHDAPSWADIAWLGWQEDTAGVHDQHDQLAHTASSSVLRQTARPTPAPSLRAQQQAEQRIQRQARASRWTSPGLRAAVTTLRTQAPTPVPAASSGYPFRGRLARWIRSRDLTCTFPGCPLLAQRCELDHVLAYPQGQTEHSNGACECVHHHQAKHAVMTVTRQPDGTMTWTNRFGTTVHRPPRPLLRGW